MNQPVGRGERPKEFQQGVDHAVLRAAILGDQPVDHRLMLLHFAAANQIA